MAARAGGDALSSCAGDVDKWEWRDGLGMDAMRAEDEANSALDLGGSAPNPVSDIYRCRESSSGSVMVWPVVVCMRLPAPFGLKSASFSSKFYYVSCIELTAGICEQVLGI
jgi:hypothetical protein